LPAPPKRWIPPANVTRYISDLEAHLQTRLLNRSSRKMSLTSSGEALFERAKSILDDVAEAEAIVSSATMQPHGVLRINARSALACCTWRRCGPSSCASIPRCSWTCR
jgi:DNA-binding transcriptional LysR family regulator